MSTTSTAAATATAAPPRRPTTRRTVDAAPEPDDLAGRMARLLRARKDLALLERRAGIVADELERAAGRLRKGWPIVPPINLPLDGLNRFAASVRDAQESIQREEEALTALLEGDRG